MCFLHTIRVSPCTIILSLRLSENAQLRHCQTRTLLVDAPSTGVEASGERQMATKPPPAAGRTSSTDRATLRSQIAFFTLRCAAPRRRCCLFLSLLGLLPRLAAWWNSLSYSRPIYRPTSGSLPHCRPPRRLIRLCISKRLSSSGRILVRFTSPTLYRVSSEDSTGSQYRALISIAVESCELSLYNLHWAASRR